MSVFVAYADETAVGGNSLGDFLVCGYIAREEDWPYFAKAWQERVLDGPPKIGEFHMTEIRSRKWREAHRLTDTDARRRTEEALRVIHSSGFIRAAASAINQSEIRSILQNRFLDSGRKIPAGMDEPDYFCHLAFFYVVLNDLAMNHPDVDKVNFYFAKKRHRISVNLLAMVDHTRSFLAEFRPDIAHLMGDAIPASPDQQLPLQAADVVSWHIQRYRSERDQSRDMDFEFLDHLLVVLKERDRIHEWDRKSLEELAAKIARFDFSEDPE